MTSDEHSMSIFAPLDELLERYPALVVCEDSIRHAIRVAGDAFQQGGRLYICGNGGSCADAEHISGEFLKGFCKRRPVSSELALELRHNAENAEEGELLSGKLQRGLPCIPLTSLSSALSAVRNDLDGQMDYAQALLALGRPGDVLLGISTSGNSRNVHLAVVVARSLGMKVLGLTGEDGGRLGCEADVAIRVPARETYQIQEFHLPVYHTLCRCVENRFFTE